MLRARVCQSRRSIPFPSLPFKIIGSRSTRTTESQLSDGTMMHATEQALFLGRNLNIYEKCSFFGDNALEQACHEPERNIQGLTVTSLESRRITQW